MALHGYGAVFTWNGQAVGGKTVVGFPKQTAEAVDTTTHESSDGFDEGMAGLRSGGSFSLAGYFKPDDSNGQIAMLTDFAAGTTRAFTSRDKNSQFTWSGNGFITKWDMGDAPIKGLIPWNAEVKVTGKPTLAVATSTGLTTPFFAVSNSGTISPAAAGDEYEYVVNFANGVTSFTITPTASAGVIEITANGVTQTVTSGVASSAITAPAAGNFLDVAIKVTETNKAPKTYTLHCAVAAA